MYEGVPAAVLWAWGSAAVVLAVMAGHRLWLFGVAGRRDQVNRYVSTAVFLAALFLLTRYPSPVRYHLDLLAPRISLYLNYSLVIWVAYTILGIARAVYARPQWHTWLWLAFAAVVQMGTGLAFARAQLIEPFSLSAEARSGDAGSLLYLLQMILYCTICAVYLAGLLLRLARQTRDDATRLGQRITAAGLLILAFGAIEETIFLLYAGLSMPVHGVLISVFVGFGVLGLSAGVVLFSPLGRKLVRRLVEAARYVRLRRLGRDIARAWPEVCLEDYAWWTVLDITGAHRRLYRIVIEWLDLRRLLVAYLPDEAIPDGAEPDPSAEAAYLARGLRRSSLRAREKAGNPDRLAKIPGELEQAGGFLLQVQRKMRYGMTSPFFRDSVVV